MQVASLQIDPALIKDITERTVQTQIVQSLGDPALLIRSVVEQVLKVKVNSNGVRSNAEYENRYDLIETLAAKAIREKCQIIINEYIRANSEAIKEAFRREIEKPESKKRMASALVAATESMILDQRFRFNISPEIL